MPSQPVPSLSRIDRFELAMSSAREVDGLWIGASVDDAQLSDALRRLEEALCLIRTHDPLRYRRLLHDLSRIWVRLLPNARANYNRAARACQLDTRFVLDQTVSVTEIASSIIHEATHARLEHRGIQYHEALRHRIESACRRQELRFACRLPNAVELQSPLQEWLEAPCDQQFWTNSAFEQRRIEGLVDALLYLSVPGWAIAVLRRARRGVRWLRRAG
jgi:hypothetical protein